MTLDISKPPADSYGARNLAHSVAEELGPIFAASADGGAPAPRRSRVRSLGPVARRSGLPIATIGAVLAAGLAGLSLGGIVGRGDSPAKAAAAPAPGVPALAEAAVPSAAPIRRPQAPADRAQTPTEAPLQGAHVLRHRSAPRPAFVVAQVRTCGGLRAAERAWCSHRTVMLADDRLRRAYGAAVRAGVARPVLISYRERWASLRSRAGSSPGEVAAGYRSMASDLSRIALARRRSGVRPTRSWWSWS